MDSNGSHCNHRHFIQLKPNGIRTMQANNVVSNIDLNNARYDATANKYDTET